jgi:Fic family protein
MDHTKFTDKMTGTLRKFRNASSGKDDWLFIPHPLPPNWTFPNELWPLLATAKESLGTLNGIGQTLPNPELLLRPLQNREAITSSSIEGTYVTPQELLLYELDPKEPSSPHDPAADWREVFNYGNALKQGCNLFAELPVCSRLICEMHKTLMTGARGERKSPGEYRRIQVQIGSAAKYVPPPPSEVPSLMGNLELFANNGDLPYDPLVMCYLVHYQFEAIHPFSDGNGRVGRALLALMIYKWLGHTLPWLYMSAFYEKYRDEYTNNLFRISSDGDWATWIEFCLNGTITQASDAVRRCDRFQRLRKEFHERVRAPSPRSHKLIELLFEAPVLTISKIAKSFDVTYHTARKDIEHLAKHGILAEVPNEHPRAFYAREIMQIAYGEQDDTEKPLREDAPIGDGDKPDDSATPSSEPSQRS